MKILIIEDEKKLRNELKIFIQNNGYEVSTIDFFDNTLTEMLKTKSDLILLDINLPKNDGEYLLKEYRKQKDTPIIMITSKNTDIDEILSINYGADDFITKPFNPLVLLSRMERILKKNNKQNIISYNDFSIDLAKSQIKTSEKVLDVTKNELNIIYYLVTNKGIIVTRDDLINFLWDSDAFVDDNTLTVNINRLRGKLKILGLEDLIVTKRGQGYIIL